MTLNFASFAAGVVWILTSIVVSSVVSSLITDAALKTAIKEEVKNTGIIERLDALEERWRQAAESVTNMR